jgi:ADP-ribose pyrophosphatase YjhB (NUDIX family)
MRKIVPKNAVLIPGKAKCAFNGVIYDVYQWEQQNFDDSVAIFEMLKRPDTVLAVCVVDGKILVLDEEQPHRGPRVRFPGGRVDKADESTLAAAQREVKEETGYAFSNWRLITVVQPQLKLEWFIHVYLAYDVARQGGTNHDAGERIKTELKTLGEIKHMAEQGTGFIGESRHLFKHITTIEDLKHLPEYHGQPVDR